MGGMTNNGKQNPPAKTVQGLPEGTLRTTMTHAVTGDLVMVQTITADPAGWWVPAPAKPTKRSQWARVQGHESVGLVVILESTGERLVLDYTGHTAITIKDREISDAEESGPTVTVTGTTVHREARGVAWCPVPVLDGDEITGDAARVTCPVCVLADTVPAEVVADAVYSYEADSYVVYRYNAVTGVSVPVPVAELAAHMAAEVAPVTACPPAPPATLAQRQALRLLGDLARSGATPQIHGQTKRTLVRDGWITVGAATGVITLTGDALAWLAGEHEADYTSHTLESGAVVYSAICNCGPDQENPRLRRVPWMSSMLTTPEDAVAVALGHGEVSRPRYEAPTLGETLAAQEAALTEPERSVCGRCSLALVWVHEMWIGEDGREHCASGPHHKALVECRECGRNLTGLAGHLVDRTLCPFGRHLVPEISVTDARVTAGEWWGVDGEGDTGEIIDDAALADLTHAGRADVVITGDRMTLTWLPEMLACTYVRRVAGTPIPTVDGVPVVVEASRGPGYTIDFGNAALASVMEACGMLTAEDVAGLPTPEEGAAWQAARVLGGSARKIGKHKRSSKVNKRRGQRAGAR